jgi:hypothetical protein
MEQKLDLLRLLRQPLKPGSDSSPGPHGSNHTSPNEINPCVSVIPADLMYDALDQRFKEKHGRDPVMVCPDAVPQNPMDDDIAERKAMQKAEGSRLSRHYWERLAYCKQSSKRLESVMGTERMSLDHLQLPPPYATPQMQQSGPDPQSSSRHPAIEPPLLREHGGSLHKTLTSWAEKNSAPILKLQRVMFFNASSESRDIANFDTSDGGATEKVSRHCMGADRRLLALFAEDGPLSLRYVKM